MRIVKMFGLAAIAAVAAMAFLGAGTASATQDTLLCKKAPGVDLLCPAGQAATLVHGIALNPLLHTNLVDVLCHESLASATLEGLGEAPNPQRALLTALTWTGCHRHGQPLGDCEVKTLLLGLLDILKLSLEDAHVKGRAADAKHNGTVVLVRCGFFIHCAYEATANTTLLALPLKEGVRSTLHANTKVVETVDPDHAEIFCPDESTWLALYQSLAGEHDVHFAS